MCVCVCACAYGCVCVCVCVCVGAFTLDCTHVYGRLLVQVQACVHVKNCGSVHTHTCMHMCGVVEGGRSVLVPHGQGSRGGDKATEESSE